MRGSLETHSVGLGICDRHTGKTKEDHSRKNTYKRKEMLREKITCDHEDNMRTSPASKKPDST